MSEARPHYERPMNYGNKLIKGKPMKSDMESPDYHQYLQTANSEFLELLNQHHGRFSRASGSR